MQSVELSEESQVFLAGEFPAMPEQGQVGAQPAVGPARVRGVVVSQLQASAGSDRSRVVIASRHGACGTKSAHREWRCRVFRTASQHYICIAMRDASSGNPDAVRRCRASRNDGNIGSRYVLHYADLAGSHVDNAAGNKKG